MGEKLLHFVEAVEHQPECLQERPYFVAETKRVSPSPRSATRGHWGDL